MRLQMQMDDFLPIAILLAQVQGLRWNTTDHPKQTNRRPIAMQVLDDVFAAFRKLFLVCFWSFRLAVVLCVSHCAGTGFIRA